MQLPRLTHHDALLALGMGLPAELPELVVPDVPPRRRRSRPPKPAAQERCETCRSRRMSGRCGLTGKHVRGGSQCRRWQPREEASDAG